MNQVNRPEDRSERLKKASGDVVLADSLTTFFYLLMRDHVPAGVIEETVQQVLSAEEECVFNNGFLAKYAMNLADELRDGRMKALTKALDASFTDHTRVGAPVKTTEKSLPGLEITAETKEKIDEAYEKMSEEERVVAEAKLEAIPDREMTEQITQVLEQEAKSNVQSDISPEEITQLERKAEELRERVRKENHKRDILSSVAAIERLKDLMPTETIQEVSKILKQEVEVELAKAKTEPTKAKGNGIFRRVHTDLAKAKTEPTKAKGNGIFRRVHTDLAIDDEDIVYSEKE